MSADRPAIRRLPSDDDALRRYAADLWLPYNRDLADRFVERAVADARDHDCEQLRLDVDVDNERALAFYERIGFEDYRKQMTMAVDPG